MAVIYGKNLAVSGEQAVDYFEIHSERDLADMVAGNTQGGVVRVDGNDRWWGFYRLYPPYSSGGNYPARFPNDVFTFTGSPDNTGNLAVSGTAKCSSIRILVPINTGRYIEAVVGFVSHGELSLGEASATDTSQPCPASPKGLYPVFGETSFQNLNVDQMQLEIRANGQAPYVTSTTNGQTLHTDGDIDAEFRFRMLTDDPGEFPIIGDLGVVKMYVTSTTCWEIKWMRYAGFDPWTVDRRNPGPVNATHVFRFSGFDCSSAGHIKNPAGTTKWPA